MELRILGPLEVCDDSGHPVGLPTGRERALLAVLVLHLGEVVSVDAIVDALWGDHPPSTAAKAVQGYISHVRRLLEPAGEDGMLVTQPPGYVLRVDDGQVDARRFESLAARGWRSLDDDPAAAVATFEQALALWRGTALSEFAFAEFAQREIHRLRSSASRRSRAVSRRSFGSGATERWSRSCRRAWTSTRFGSGCAAS